MAQWGARIYEVPISYSGRTYDEGKKIKARDAVKARWEIFRCRILDVRFTKHNGFYALKSMSRAHRYNRWLLRHCRPFIGKRILEAGAGIGNFSAMLGNCERLVLLDRDPLYVKYLKSRMGERDHVCIVQADLAKAANIGKWRDERLDTVLCMNVLEHIEDDEQVLRRFHDWLTPNGHCIVVAPAGKGLFSGLDQELGHLRRYDPQELQEKMQRAGFDVVSSRRVCRSAALVWWIFGRLLRLPAHSPRLTGWFDRLFPLTRLLDRGVPFCGISIVMAGRSRGPGTSRRDAETREV